MILLEGWVSMEESLNNPEVQELKKTFKTLIDNEKQKIENQLEFLKSLESSTKNKTTKTSLEISAKKLLSESILKLYSTLEN